MTNCHYLLLYLFPILARFVEDNVAHKAIIGGYEAGLHEFPYQVAILYYGINVCGGGIIDDQFILTAAHCVIPKTDCEYPEELTILAGTNNLNKTDKPAVKVAIKKIYIPIEFTPGATNTTGDIAVLKLKHPLGLFHHKHFLKGLELPKSEHEIYTNKRVVITGFGWNWVVIDEKKETRKGNSTDQILRFAEADVISNKECQQDWHKRKVSEKHNICARIKQRDHSKPRGTCAGDSGNPLVYEGRVVVGILSVGIINCSEIGKATIYTRVSHYLNFIINAIHDIDAPDIRTHKHKDTCHIQK